MAHYYVPPWGRGRGPGRPRKRVRKGWMYRELFFEPPGWTEEIYITDDELEAMRLVDYLGLKQEEAAQQMGVSRATVWRLLESGRKKLVEALLFGKRIRIVKSEEG